MTETKLKGLVRKLNQDKGYGFLVASPGGVEYFFHRSACPEFEQLTEGAVVTFSEGKRGEKGPRAEGVRMIA